jgi:hypothetical protein
VREFLQITKLLYARFLTLLLPPLSAPVQTGPGAHPASYTMGTGSFPVVQRPGRGVDHPPHLVPRLKKELSYTSTHYEAFVACYRVKFPSLNIMVELNGHTKRLEKITFHIFYSMRFYTEDEKIKNSESSGFQLSLKLICP